jgi:hypothetical protein
VLGARLTFRNAAPEGATPLGDSGGAIAVLWLPEHAPTNTGSFPVLAPEADREPERPKRLKLLRLKRRG